MAKIIKLTESDLNRIVKRILSEQPTKTAQPPSQGLSPGATGFLTSASAGVLPTILQLINGSDAASKKVWKIINTCEKNKFPVTPRTNQIADSVYDAITGLGTDESAVYSAMKQPKTIDEFCGVVKSYKSSYGETLWDALNGDFSAESEWVEIMRPLRDVVLKSQMMQKNKMSQTQPKTTGQQPKPAQPQARPAQPQARPAQPNTVGRPSQPQARPAQPNTVGRPSQPPRRP